MADHARRRSLVVIILAAAVAVLGLSAVIWLAPSLCMHFQRKAMLGRLEDLDAVADCEIDSNGRLLVSIAFYEPVSDERLREVMQVAKGRLEGILLNESHITDEGLLLLCNERHLKWLSVDNTRITDQGLARLSGLPSLETLSLKNTPVRGPGLAFLRDCPNLTQLGLDGTLIDDGALRLLGALHGLENIGLSGTNVTVEGLRHLAKLTTLCDLGLRDTGITPNDIDTLRQFLPRNCRVYLQVDRSYPMSPESGIRPLDLAPQEPNLEVKNGAGEPPTLKPQPDTRELEPPEPLPDDIVRAWEAAGAQVGWMRVNEHGAIEFVGELEGRAGDLPAFKFRQLKEHILADLPAPATPFGLDLSFTQVTDAELKGLAGLKNLQTLDLSVSQVPIAGLKELGGLTNLQRVVLSNSQVTDAGLKELTGLKNLQWLGLLETQVTDAGVRQLREALPQCHIVHEPLRATKAH